MNREWEVLQDYVRDRLREIDGNAVVTRGSGSVKGDGDVKSERFLAECKQRSRKNIVIQQEFWNKIRTEADLLNKIPALISQNETKDIVISFNFDDFIEFVKEIKEGT